MAAVWSVIPPPSEEEEFALINSLVTNARLHPESDLHGTTACRIFVVGQHGEFVDGRESGRHPLVFQIAQMIAKYMGTSDRVWNINNAFDVGNNRMVTMFRNISSPWINDATANGLWDNGVVYAQAYDTSQFFYPEFPTVYADDTSVLRSLINVFAAVECIKVEYGTWRQFSPTSRLTNDQLKDNIAKFTAEKTNATFSNRFVVKPEVNFTPYDIQTGRSWTLNMHLYCNPNRDTVYTSVVAHRMSDLAAE